MGREVLHRMKNLSIAAIFAMLVFGMPLLPALAQGPGGATPAPGANQMMGGMMENCQKHCQTLSAALDEITKTIADAKKTNDGAIPPAVVDQIEAGLAKMQGQMKECHGMMEHMQQMMQMQGRGGMMNQPAPVPSR
jgi:hypothetical protein